MFMISTSDGYEKTIPSNYWMNRFDEYSQALEYMFLIYVAM